jgi:protein-glucosylgalactosylhydroxylysine glucosidase
MKTRLIRCTLPLLIAVVAACTPPFADEPIDRRALVQRHIPVLESPDPLSPFTVGNGEFAYTVDVTGLQTFDDYYESGIPLGTLSNWGWHSAPNPEGYTLERTFRFYDARDRKIPYASDQHSEAGQWLRANPHRLHLGKIGFDLRRPDDSAIELEDLAGVYQRADIWRGVIESRFTVLDEEVNVETAVHPASDRIAVRVRSELLPGGGVSIDFNFPYGSQAWGKTTADWNSPDRHATEILRREDSGVLLRRTLDDTVYFLKVEWRGAAVFQQKDGHRYLLTIRDGNDFSFVANFSRAEPEVPLPEASDIFSDTAAHWQSFWETGGAIDLSLSSDPRALELERRIVLSRYLTAIQTAGSLPPAETGLTCNSWHGKFHLEMHWWHGVHYALWGKPELFEKSLPWYQTLLPQARDTARRQGYAGARWPKMVAYDGRESPSTVGPFLIWQQPHPIYYAELLYRHRGDEAVLHRFKDIVFASADFMASYPQLDIAGNRYVLGPPLIPAQEIYKPDETFNPAFELAYWKYGLETAQTWRERFKLPRDKKWDEVLKRLSALPLNDGLYQNAGNALNTFEDAFHRNDHPSVLGAFGMLPNAAIDRKAMTRTLERVLESWNWQRTWGWDYPMIAMNAARLGRPELAVEALLMDVPKNRYLNNGHNYQDERLPLYLPGNGGLLAAVAMMAAGWEGAPAGHAPGFPKNGLWTVRYEGLSPLQ